MSKQRQGVQYLKGIENPRCKNRNTFPRKTKKIGQKKNKLSRIIS